MATIKQVLFSSAVLGAIAGSAWQAPEASAFAIRRGAPECYVLADGVSGTIAGGVITNNTDDSIFAYCPSPENGAIGASQVKTLNIHGTNASSVDYSYAAVCWSNWFDDGGGCRNFQQTPTGTAPFALELGAPNFSSTWVTGDEANFKYVMVRLGRRRTPSTYSPTTFRGIYYAG
jgi:hypothetical protein